MSPIGGPRLDALTTQKFDNVIQNALANLSHKIFVEADQHANESINTNDRRFAQFRIDDNANDIHALLKVNKDILLKPERNIDREIANLTQKQREVFNQILEYSPNSGYEIAFHLFDQGLQLMEGSTDMRKSKLFKMALLDTFKTQAKNF